MGWHMHPAGHWSRDYLVGYLPDFEGTNADSKKIHVYRVRDIIFDATEPVIFPLKDARACDGNHQDC